MREFKSIADNVVAFRGAGIAAATRSVCWVTDEMIELFRNGGAGTVVSGFCDALLQADHRVHVLYTGHIDTAAAQTRKAIDHLKARGIRFVSLQELGFPTHTLTARSQSIHRWLKAQTFDIVHFHDFNGSGHAACAAKRMGLAYSQTLLCITNFGTSRWGWDCLERFLQQPDELERDWLERSAIENADAVLCHSLHMARWLERQGYCLPEATTVQPSIVPFIPGQDGPCGRTSSEIREVAFFGRQEIRKGMRLFVDAAKQISKTHPDMRFSFIGKYSHIDYEHSGAYVLSRLEHIPNDISFFADFTRDEALRYLKSPDVLAVMPSVDDNFPGTVIEAITEGIEFIASDRGGIPEIVHPDDHAARLFPLTSHDLAAAVERVIAKRPHRPKLRFDPADNVAAWMDWHARVPVEASKQALMDPLVSICIIHHNRPHFLAMVIDGLKRQTYQHFEVILVDDGSTEQEALRYVDYLQQEPLGFPFKLVRTPDVFLGAARNAGVAASTGEYVVFVDDDNVPRKMMIETLVRAAQHANLDVVTCLAYMLEGDQEPDEGGLCNIGYYPAGGPVSAGLIENVFGDANAMFRREAFNQLSGFDPTPGVGAEDWDLFARAVLSGYKLAVIPEPLYWYRMHQGQLTFRPHSTHLYHERLLSSYWSAIQKGLHPDIKDLLRVYMGRFAEDKLIGRASHFFSERVTGEDQKALVPYVNDVKESNRRLAMICMKMGRFRDAARLVVRGDDVFGHLISLGNQISARYRFEMRHPQGYYGDHATTRSLPILKSMLSNVRPISVPVTHTNSDLVFYEAFSNRIRVHPQLGRVTMAVLQDAFPPGQANVSAEIIVDHINGPEVKFTLMLVSRDVAGTLEGSTLPSTFVVATSVSVTPVDGSTFIQVSLDKPSLEALTIVLATEAPVSTDYGWAYFGDFKLSA